MDPYQEDTEMVRTLSCFLPLFLTSASVQFDFPTSGSHITPLVRPTFTRTQPDSSSRASHKQKAILKGFSDAILGIETSIRDLTFLPPEAVESIPVHIKTIQDDLEKYTPYGKGLMNRKSELVQRLQACLHSYAIMQASSSGSTTPSATFDASHHYQGAISKLPPLVQIIALLLVVARLVLSLSRRDVDFLLGVISIFMSHVVQLDGNSHLAHSRRRLPRTFQTMLSKFGLDGKCLIYCVCPECHCTYLPDQHGRYPVVCTNMDTPVSQCTARLLGDDNQPLKPFNHHLFVDYVAGLLSRPDFEKYIDESCHDFENSYSLQARSTSSPMQSPFDARFLREFQGPDGRPFLSTVEGEVRMIFTMYLDFFQAEGISLRKKSNNIGIISLACLNLPPSVRYRPANMWVDIIPGPEEPSLTKINHYTRPVVDELLKAWTNGLALSRTALHSEGRLARCAVVAGIFDLPAARKAAGLAAHQHRIFCHRCNAWHTVKMEGQQKMTLDQLRGRSDHEQWATRVCAELRAAAESWRSASTVEEQEAVFNLYGVRYSEFWRLPYWDPITMLVVDPMHCILLGLAKRHASKVLLLTEVDAQARTPRQPAFSHSFTVPEIVDVVVSKDTSDPIDHADFQPQPPGRHRFGHPYTSKDVAELATIHKALTAPFFEGDIDPSDKYPKNLERLMTALNKPQIAALKFVTDDLSLQVNVPVGAQRRSVRKEDYVNALAEWVSAY